MKKPGKRAVTKQLEILNSVEGKGPVDWAVVLMLAQWNSSGLLFPLDSYFTPSMTTEEKSAVRVTWGWLRGITSESPVEYLGYAELPDPPHKYKFILYAGIFAVLLGLVGLLVK